VEIPKLYPDDLEKVYVHHDAASSHTAKFTEAYSAKLKAENGVTLIRKQDIPVKSPDASPMDFFGFGLLKQRLFRNKVKTMTGLWKVLKEEWGKVTQETVNKVMDSWKLRCRHIYQGSGEHVEQTKKIHRRRV